jgi:TolB-like protein/Flp pilus assembly protein TadD
MDLLANLKQRKIVQWGLAYLAAAWLVMQVVDVLGGRWGISAASARIVDLALVAGFFVALVLAWYHGEQGRQRVSGAEILIITGLLAIAGLLLTQLDREDTADDRNGVADDASIAVLPFELLSDQRQDEFFAIGIHDDLITRLSGIDGLKVISRTSVMQYVDSDKSIPIIAGELGVATLMQGTVQRGGDRIRVAAQLIDALSDEYVWEAKYDEKLTAANVFQIQSQLTSRIAEELNMRLLPGVQERIDSQHTDNLVAWDLVSRGRILLDKTRSQPDLESATTLFQRSIEEDPEYAPAWSGLALSITQLVSWHFWDEDELANALAAANRAIELDPNLSEGFVAHGNLLRLQRRFDDSSVALQRALELSPGSARAHTIYSVLLRDVGEFQASVKAARRSIELGPRAMRNRDILLQNLYFGRKFENVIAEADEMLELESDAAYALYWKGMANAWLGNAEEAIAASAKAIDVGGNAPYLDSGLAFTYAKIGETMLAREMLVTAEQDGWPLVEIGLAYAWLGDLDKAFEFINRALDERPTALVYLSTDPAADPLREDPRWAKLDKELQRPNDNL